MIVLIQADEGDTGTVFMATDKNGLLALVKESYRNESTQAPDEHEHLKAKQLALIKMIESHVGDSGRHILDPVRPVWEKWTLIIGTGVWLQ